jgi:hypothetical protein
MGKLCVSVAAVSVEPVVAVVATYSTVCVAPVPWISSANAPRPVVWKSRSVVSQARTTALPADAAAVRRVTWGQKGAARSAPCPP